MPNVLELKNLHIHYRTTRGESHAVDGVSLSLEKGDYLGLVGESGCGKSSIAKAILGIMAPNGRVSEGRIMLSGRNLAQTKDAEMRKLRWRDIALVPQSAMTGFDPVYTIERQLDEAIVAHAQMPAAQRRVRIEELFSMVGIDHGRLSDYPHQFSGGMRQRAMIAMAMVLDPEVIVADEPTTGLDVIVQDQIMRHIKALHDRFQKTMLLITHDLALVAENCNKIAVMYAGKIMESGGREVFDEPCHPYTMGLRNAFPDLDDDSSDLISIPGTPPDLVLPPSGCRFSARCPFVTNECRLVDPELRFVGDGHQVACHHAERAGELRLLARRGSTWAAGVGRTESLEA